jgi:hypothetical protein
LREHLPLFADWSYFGSRHSPSVAASLTSPRIYAKNPWKPGRSRHDRKLNERRF